MARTPKSPTQNPEPLTPGEQTIVDPANPGTNTEETTSTDATEVTTPPADDTVADKDKEKAAKKKVPKSTAKPAAEKKGPQEDVTVPGPNDADQEEDNTDVNHRGSFSVAQAIAYLATQPDPNAAFHALKRERRLNDVTGTLIKAREDGLIATPEED